MSRNPGILIVGQELAATHCLQEMLRRSYRTLLADSAPQALAVLREHKVQVVLCEHRPPGISGIAFLCRVRREYPKVVRLLFSCQAEPWISSEVANQPGLCRYLDSPWDPDELLPIVRQAVERYEAEAAAKQSRGTKSHSVPDGLRPGDKLGDYRLVNQLARGGMGVVYEAVHTRLKRVVALKVLPADRLADEQAITRFRREIRATGRLNHPNIVRAYDARKVKGVHFLVLEFVEGVNLAQLLKYQPRFEIPDACEVIRQAALGLQHASEHGLVHRDLKPANLMLTPAGLIKVLDLGLARWFNELPFGNEGIPIGYVVGTADYVAPEQALGTAVVDSRADIYSLGCTLYKVLTGQPPYAGPAYRTVAQKLAGHVHAPVPLVRQVRPEVPKPLESILLRLLAKAPVDRFAAPAEVSTALQPFTVGSDLAGLLASARSAELLANSERGTPPTTCDRLPEKSAC
jgi:CheY-like chemotaxis protein